MAKANKAQAQAAKKAAYWSKQYNNASYAARPDQAHIRHTYDKWQEQEAAFLAAGGDDTTYVENSDTVKILLLGGAFFLVVFVIFGAGYALWTGSDSSGSSDSSPSSAVDWSTYSPTLKSSIDSDAAAGDCGALQKSFDTAFSNNSAQRERTGTGNVELMAYIQTQLERAGCQ
jgi:hypothetical protein